MNLLYLLLRTSRQTVLMAVGAGIISGAGGALLIAVINSALTEPDMPGVLAALGFAGLALIVLISQVVSQVLLSTLSQGAIYDLRIHLSERILSTPLRRMEEIGAPRMLAALTDDVFVITNAMLGMPSLCINIVTMLVCMAYLAWLSWTVLLGLLGFLAVGIFSYQMLVARANNSLRTAREVQDSLFKSFQAMTGGFKELKLHEPRRRAFFSRMLKPAAEQYRSHNITGSVLYISAGTLGQALFYGFIAILLFVIPLFNQVSPQTMMGYILAILFIWTPIGSVLSVIPMLGRARIALRKIESLGLSLGDAQANAERNEVEAVRCWEQIELTGVVHSYAGEERESLFMLGPLDLAFHPAEIVFLIGGNGSGKTTFAKLLAGLYTPEAGEIRVDGRLITDDGREAYRQIFSAVFSDFYLFKDLLGLESPNLDERVQTYLTDFHLERKVSIRDGALSTTDLSQGQRKRLALLSAYLEDRPFYLFDEWAADQDPLFREIFYTRILSDLKSRGKSVLVITHDDRYFHLADRVIKLEYGQLVTTEESTPAGILADAEADQQALTYAEVI